MMRSCNMCKMLEVPLLLLALVLLLSRAGVVDVSMGVAPSSGRKDMVVQKKKYRQSRLTKVSMTGMTYL